MKYTLSELEGLALQANPDATFRRYQNSRDTKAYGVKVFLQGTYIGSLRLDGLATVAIEHVNIDERLVTQQVFLETLRDSKEP